MRVIITSIPDVENPPPVDYLIGLSKYEMLKIINEDKSIINEMIERMKESLIKEEHFHNTTYA